MKEERGAKGEAATFDKGQQLQFVMCNAIALLIFEKC